MPRPPQEFEGFVGQAQTVRLLRRYIDGVRKRGKVFPNTLLTGCPGIGKTTLVRAVAQVIGTNVRPMVASRDFETAPFVEVLAATAHGDIVFIDEAHLLPKAFQDILLGAAGEDRRIQKMEGRRISVAETISLAEFTLCLATDRPGAISKALRDRVSITLHLMPYPPREMRVIVERVCQQEDVVLNGHAIGVLARAARGIPREAGKLLKLLASYYPDQRQELTKPLVEEFLDANDIDPETMLRRNERRYLALLARVAHPVNLGFISESLGTDPMDLRRSVEPFLIQEGLLHIGSKGRELTTKGKEFAKRFVAAEDELTVQNEN